MAACLMVTYICMVKNCSPGFWTKLFEPHDEKTCLCHILTTKMQISLCIRV